MGCQSSDRTVERMGFFRCLAVHQFCSWSNWHTAIMRAPEATANLLPLGDHLTVVAERVRRSRTKVGFHAPLLPFDLS